MCDDLFLKTNWSVLSRYAGTPILGLAARQNIVGCTFFGQSPYWKILKAPNLSSRLQKKTSERPQRADLLLSSPCVGPFSAANRLEKKKGGACGLLLARSKRQGLLIVIKIH